MLTLTARSTGAPSFTTERSARFPLDPESLAGRRISRYLTEPAGLGNKLVGISDGTSNAAASELAHEKRIREELARLSLFLPRV